MKTITPLFSILQSLGFLTLLLVGSLQLEAQNTKKATIKGKIIDTQTSAPLGYATIRVHKTADSSLVSGAISDDKGQFLVEVPYGKYYTVVEFIGYKSLKSSMFEVSKEQSVQDLGVLKIETSSRTLDEVVVQAEKSSMELSLDKRIFNVGKDLANAGGTAIDILSNVPSVSVDTEGNVKLRGSDGVRILIDGKPSGLVSFKGGAGLQQLQGNQIERVEIITNPSARYEAEGMSGIINIVLKKERKQGFNGSFEVVTGFRPNFGVAANVNYRKNKLNFFLNYGIAYRIPISAGRLYQEVYGKDTTAILQQTNNGEVRTVANTIRGGLDYFFNDKNILTASYQFRRTDVLRITNNQYKDYINTLSNLNTITDRQQRETEAEPYSEYAITYKKTYNKKGQELIADVRYLTYWERSDQTFTQSSVFANGSPNKKGDLLQKSLNDEYENQLIAQLDYVQPIGKEGKFETGLRSSFRDMVNDYIVTQRNEQGVFEPLPGLDNYFIYKENIHGVYGIIGNKTKKFSYQAGLRAEMTDVKTILQETNQSNPRQYTNLFPSAHFTYNINQENAFQLSYSRRVRRPTYNDLSPYVTFSDQRNFFSGNPDLNPEFTNSFDLGHIKYFEKGSFTSSLYYRHTNGKVLRIRRVDAQGFSNTRPENLATEDAFGAEFTSTYTPVKWWKLDFNFNFFRAITDGQNLDNTFKADTYSWFARQTSRFNLAQGTDLQIRANYEAPQQLPQGRRKSRTFVDLAFSKEILKGKGTLTFNVIDLFNSRYMRTVTEGLNFYTDATMGMRARQINLTVMYRLNQAAGAKKQKSLISGEEG
ncbi:TonB-dependent receptor domain-containing protein [Runella zeae]|uniref:TonB-dependent receptor domain-containing protein n=1 Tax=Runella zeae TaxID=94255 RepID=UPI0003FB347E|nr:TonB-dependent receptor [Runella zeae]